MRITNNMILNNSSSNINDVKTSLDKTNTQMTNQQKINRPSEDPVIAVRSLRLQTTYAKTEQYYRKNIPDAESWLDVTETALLNMKDIITDMRTLAVNGATGTLTQDDRNTILTQLKSLQEEIYAEGNSQYAGRTVFTGYRTDKMLTFMSGENETAYNITQKISSENMIQSRYYSNEVDIPTSPTEVKALDDTMREGMTTAETNYYRMTLAYNDINGAKDAAGNSVDAFDPANIKITYPKLDALGLKQYVDVPKKDAAGNDIQKVNPDGTPMVDQAGNPVYEMEKELVTDTITPDNITIYPSELEWEAAGADGTKTVGDNEIVIIQSTGDVIFGKDLAYNMISNNATLDITYAKTGFLPSELRPEYYFDCTNITDPAKPIDYVKENREYDINYTIAENQSLKVNVEAYNIFDHSIYQDMSDMINAVTYAIEAHEKMAKIDNMLKDPYYADDESQEYLKKWKSLVQKECDYADDNMDKLYTSELKNCDKYLADMNLSITRLGCTMDTLDMTKKRMSEYEENVLQLQSENDNLDISQVIIDYTAVYTAYQSSLTAAGRLYQQTLLNYI